MALATDSPFATRRSISYFTCAISDGSKKLSSANKSPGFAIVLLFNLNRCKSAVVERESESRKLCAHHQRMDVPANRLWSGDGAGNDQLLRFRFRCPVYAESGRRNIP